MRTKGRLIWLENHQAGSHYHSTWRGSNHHEGLLCTFVAVCFVRWAKRYLATLLLHTYLLKFHGRIRTLYLSSTMIGLSCCSDLADGLWVDTKVTSRCGQLTKRMSIQHRMGMQPNSKKDESEKGVCLLFSPFEMSTPNCSNCFIGWVAILSHISLEESSWSTMAGRQHLRSILTHSCLLNEIWEPREAPCIASYEVGCCAHGSEHQHTNIGFDCTHKLCRNRHWNE